MIKNEVAYDDKGQDTWNEWEVQCDSCGEYASSEMSASYQQAISLATENGYQWVKSDNGLGKELRCQTCVLEQ